MKPNRLASLLILAAGVALVAAPSTVTKGAGPSTRIDPGLDAFIRRIRAVDHHSHVNTVAPDDAEADALPLEVLMPFPIPATLRPDSPAWLAAYRALYGYPHADLDERHLPELRSRMEQVRQEQGERFPSWVLDRIGTDVMLANRVAMGPGLTAPRFRWVSFVDALMLPLSTETVRSASPDREKLYPFEETLLRRYLADLKIDRLPATLDAYLATVVAPTLARQKQAGCLAVKFEAALLRSLDFADVPAAAARRVYAAHVHAGPPSAADYKALQDFLFRSIAREAGRLGLAVHVHSFEGPGAFYGAAGADPLLLEPSLNDPALRDTRFVIVHGGGMYASHAAALLWKPNVYVDTSAMALLYPPAALARVLEGWLRQYPERVLFGTDAAAFGPDAGWELAAWIATDQARQALGIALSDMMANGDVTRARAEEIATLVLRGNAEKLYGLAIVSRPPM